MLSFESKLKCMKRPVIYQLIVRLFSNQNTTNRFDGSLEENGCGKFNHITAKALDEIKEMGFTHVWYTGVLEHSTTTKTGELAGDPPCVVKGKAGSPYAIRDYYDVAADLAENHEKRMAEFEALILRTHNSGLKAIIDFVPNHVARTYHSDMMPAGVSGFGQADDQTKPFHPQNNYYYLPGETLNLPVTGDNCAFTEYPAKATGNDCFTASPAIGDWYETVKLNYGVDYQGGHTHHFEPVPDTWIKMNHILNYWAEKGIDGFRCDMASMVPVAFWNQAIKAVKTKFPAVQFIAEIYEPWLYGEFINQGGFDYLYDKVGLYDTLRAVVTRQAPAGQISHCWRSIEGLGDHMLNFIENHDEQRIASLYFAGTPLAGIPAFTVAALMNRGSVLLYSGQEVGEDGSLPTGYSGDDGRTSIFDYGSMASLVRWVSGNFDTGRFDAESQKLHKSYAAVLRLVNSFDAFRLGDFYDLMWVNHQGTGFPDNHLYVFLRHYEQEVMLIAANFSPERRSADTCIPNHAIRLTGLRTQDSATIASLTDDREIMAARDASGDLRTTISLDGFGIFIGKILDN